MDFGLGIGVTNDPSLFGRFMSEEKCEKHDVTFEVADSDNPTDLIKASQRAVCAAMKKVVSGLRSDVGGPGLTWEQIEYLIDGFAKKEPHVITQSEEL